MVIRNLIFLVHPNEENNISPEESRSDEDFIPDVQYENNPIKDDIKLLADVPLNEEENIPKEQSNYLIQGIEILRKNDLSGSNKSKMTEFFKLSADEGDPKGQVMYGGCLYRGWGVETDLVEARRFFKLAMEQGSPDGLLWYWICDWENGAQVFKKLAEDGNPGGMFWYGACLFQGLGVDPDIEQAHAFMEMAAENGDSYWAKQHSVISRIGYFGIPQSEESAAFYDELSNQKTMNDLSFFSPGFF